jgi:hypothetical protein
MNVRQPSEPRPRQYLHSDDDPRNHGILGPNDLYVLPLPPEPSWWEKAIWNVEQWGSDKWDAFKTDMKNFGHWFWD